MRIPGRANEGIGVEDRRRRFRALHERGHAFVMPNAWDAGSARILTALGFEAIGTTSAGYAFATGRRDSEGMLSRAEVIANAEEIAAATHLPVSADLESGFGVEPEVCAETVRAAVSAGLAGGSIEDTTGRTEAPIFPFEHAVERVRAAVEAAKGTGFVLTARAENFICGRPDLEDTLRRLTAFAEAGADVVYAPGLPDLGAISRACAEAGRPVNVVMGLSGPSWTVETLSTAGVTRISTGGSLARAALGALIRGAREIRETGSFGYASQAVPDAEIRTWMAPPDGAPPADEKGRQFEGRNRRPSRTRDMKRNRTVRSLTAGDTAAACLPTRYACYCTRVARS